MADKMRVTSLIGGIQWLEQFYSMSTERDSKLSASVGAVWLNRMDFSSA
jgi:hypothetical protein